jgi:hypothetical protein
LLFTEVAEASRAGLITAGGSFFGADQPMIGLMVEALCNLKTAELMGQVQIRVAKKMLDAERQNGAAAIQLIEAASQGVARAGDELVAKATGLGGSLDVMA